MTDPTRKAAATRAKTVALCRALSEWRGGLPPALEGAAFMRGLDEVMALMLELWDDVEPQKTEKRCGHPFFGGTCCLGLGHTGPHQGKR